MQRAGLGWARPYMEAIWAKEAASRGGGSVGGVRPGSAGILGGGGGVGVPTRYYVYCTIPCKTGSFNIFQCRRTNKRKSKWARKAAQSNRPMSTSVKVAIGAVVALISIVTGYSIFEAAY